MTRPPALAPATARADRSVQPARTTPVSWIWPTLRIALAWVFLWAFLDKTFALGWATGRDAETGSVDVFGPAAWISGGSPTTGFLAHGASGPFAPAFQALAGNALVDWLFMLGMGGVGLGLLLGIATRLTTVAGIALMVLLKLAVWASENNPIVDDHIIYAFLLVGLAVIPDARRCSLAAVWATLPFVRRAAILR